ncbi:MAG TPA: cell envelope integrity protein CreD [Chitinophagaceae bacterium]|nr:cell envelope integrity protein CreD [Chitinophagaceae bacterium]
METELILRTGSQSSKTLIKGIITGILILVMMIPTIFIMNLVSEREERQKQVAAEVSSKWASSQTLSGPFLYIPYTYTANDAEGKPVQVKEQFWVLPENLDINGQMFPEVRERSIYKVLLYRSTLTVRGNIEIKLPANVDPSTVQWKDARICMGLSDFKGIEEKIMLRAGDNDIELAPGLPGNELDSVGLSAPIDIIATDTGRTISFSTVLKLKGSERLHFIPLAGNSSYTLESKWPAPSFDGNNLPSDRNVSDSGFSAKWVFNKANLPFSTVLNKTNFDTRALAFGVTMVQPADQYAKTDRAVKYAILVIGLTFSLFFIVELLQNKPVHPVQYILIGLALVIFYTLLLSFSEFILFDIAYLLAAIATISLISLYVKAHFGNWRAAAIFSSALTLLYGFIFVLVRLEDTALLVGSLGLFLILAIAMYLSRKIDWYGKN